ncbi:MAG: lactonase family protein [Clostridia bacterium]|nr:lactonase family protein [Clostridia bacterium]
MSCNLYIASCAAEGGIWHYRLTDGIPEPVGLTPMEYPMYMILTGSGDGKKMHILLQKPYENDVSGLVTYRIAENGTLYDPSPMISTLGVEACHLCAEGERVYAVNYTSGSVFATPDRLVTHTGRSVHPLRQTEPHPHFVDHTPDGQYLCVTDLGTDQILIYDKELNLQSAVHLPDGHGPRHLAFHEDRCHVFCMNELASTVSLLRYENGRMELLQTVSALPEGYCGESTGAAIRCIGNTVYTSNRGHDSIAVFEFSASGLTLRRTIPTYGSSPRDFIVEGNFLISTNQFGNNVCFVSDKDGALLTEIRMPAPLCVLTDAEF